MARVARLPAPPPIVDGGMDRFYVGDFAEIRNEGLHGFTEGTVGVITMVGIHDNLGNAGYKLDVRQADQSVRSRYVEEKDLRKPKKEPKPLPAEEQLTAEAKQEPTLIKAKAMSQRQARQVREAKEQKAQDKDQIANRSRDRADASIVATSKAETDAGTRKVPAVVKATTKAGSLAKAKAQDSTVKKGKVAQPKGSAPAKVKVKAIKPAKVIKAVKTAKAIKAVAKDPKAGKVKAKAVKNRKG